jgi:hypothetical protein
LLEPRFKIDSDDNVLLGDTSIHGSLQLVGGAVKFENSVLNAPDAPTDPMMYRTTEGNGDELRIDLGTYDEAKNQKFVIGFTAEDGTFKPSITLQYATPPAGNEPLPLLTISGDLKLEGRILNKDLIERSLSGETVAALLASFQAGTIAAGGS